MKSAVVAFVAAFVALGQIKLEFFKRYYDTDLLDEYDFIIVGSGTSGSVVASRLSENANVTVLVIEAGECGRGDPDIDVPYWESKLVFSSKDWRYFTAPQVNANNRVLPYTRGQVGGGCSALNSMIYSRGSKRDFDRWDQELGATGWSFNDVEPYFRKVEKVTDYDLSNRLGKEGKVSLSRGFYVAPFYDFISKAFQNIGFAAVDVLRDGGIKEGISKITSSVFNGTRQHSAQSYLWSEYESRMDRLHLSFNSLVQKILIHTSGDAHRAYGVQFMKNGTVREIRARKEVIVSAGVINSPQLLMLSGIGPREHLENMNINVNVDLPGVGSNFQDHVGVLTYYYGAKLPLNHTYTERQISETFAHYVTGKPSPFNGNRGLSSAVAYVKSTNKRNSSIPNVQIYFNPISLKKPLYWPQISTKLIQSVKKFQNDVYAHFVALPTLLDVKSKGSVRLLTDSARVQPNIDPNIFSHPEDMENLIGGYRVLENLEESKLFKHFRIKRVSHPECRHLLSEEDLPRSDEFYRCVTKKSVFTFNHGCCTAKIGASVDNMAVVDPRLRVYNVEGLRVADASVMPKVVSANTQAACYMIGEKAADMIKQDWSLI